jgi:hypothetical protein
MSTLLIVVPQGRAYCGRATLVGANGKVVAGPFRALATASGRIARKNGNAACDPLRPFGHPPIGSYIVAGSLPPTYRHPRRPGRFGAVGALLLKATGGDALASVSFGRTFIVLHGGPLDAAKRLRLTRGGIRMSDADLLSLLRDVNFAHQAGDDLSFVELVEVAAEDIDSVPTTDLRGARRLGRMGSTDVSSPMREAALFMSLWFGGARSDSMKGVDRRAFLRSALILVGGLTVSACGSNSGPPPPPCESVTEPDGTIVNSCDTDGYGVGGGVG